MAMKKKGKKEAPCMICGEISSESICLPCRNKIQGEAIEKKQQIEKKGRTKKEGA
jgi:hypothetical protein